MVQYEVAAKRVSVAAFAATASILHLHVVAAAFRVRRGGRRCERNPLEVGDLLVLSGARLQFHHMGHSFPEGRNQICRRRWDRLGSRFRGQLVLCLCCLHLRLEGHHPLLS